MRCVLCAICLSGCVAHTYYIDQAESQRAVQQLQQRSEVIVRARHEKPDHDVSLRLTANDKVLPVRGGVTLQPVPLRALQVDPTVDGVRFQQRGLGQLELTAGIAGTVVGYLVSTLMAVSGKNAKGIYAIPVYGPARWTKDTAGGCSGLGCAVVPFIYFAGASVIVLHIGGPISIIKGSYDLRPTREVAEPTTRATLPAPPSPFTLSFSWTF